MIIVDQDTKALFLDKIKTLLLHGESVQTMKTVKTKKVRTFRPISQLLQEDNDEIIETTDTVSSDRTTQMKPCPKWVYDLIIKSMSIETAITLLQSQGYIVADPNDDIGFDNNNEQKGLSEFAISQISQRLLGLEE